MAFINCTNITVLNKTKSYTSMSEQTSLLTHEKQDLIKENAAK